MLGSKSMLQGSRAAGRTHRHDLRAVSPCGSMHIQRAAQRQQRKQQAGQRLVITAVGPLSMHLPQRQAVTATAAAVEVSTTVTSTDPEVEFLGVLDGMQTVRGVMEVDAPADLVYAILTDYDRCSEVFENISASQTVEEDGIKQVVQACSWRFLAFQGSFNVHLSVMEDAQARSLVFRLIKSSFMRDFEGRWQVAPVPSSAGSSGVGGGSAGAGRARIEHVLAVKPLMPIPAAISNYTRGIFTRQVGNILRDLEREIASKTRSANN